MGRMDRLDSDLTNLLSCALYCCSPLLDMSGDLRGVCKGCTAVVELVILDDMS
jgi:hypothetical protein